MTSHQRGNRLDGRLLTVLLALVAFAAVAMAPVVAHAKGGAKPTLKVKASQASLVSKGKLKVTVKSQKSLRVRIGARIQQGGKKTKLTPSGGLRVRKGKTAKITLPLTKDGRRLVQSCLSSKVIVTATTTGKGKHRKYTKKATMKRDPKRCKGVNPLGVDVEHADRCDPISEPGQQCLFPYPNDFYTRADSSTPTGRRLDLKSASMPQNKDGVPIDPTDINTSDGFSPGAPIVLRVPGMDSPEAFAQTNPVPITNMDASFDSNQPIVLIDAATGERQLIWSELDSNATTPDQTVLEIHPGKNLKDGHRYIVALRGMKDASGATLDPPEGFRLFRDDIPTGIPAIESRRDHFEQMFGELRSAGIARKHLYMAWDFTVASTENLTGRMLDMRNDAFATDLGDTNLNDGSIAGTTSPDFNVDTVVDYPTATGNGVEDIRQVIGTFEVPCYMKDPDGAGPLNPCDPGSTLNLNASGVPQQNGTYTARFKCNIPRSAVTETTPGNFDVTDPARPSLYGHGLFGTYNETFSTNIRQLGTENNVVTCGTDWIGMADEDEIPVALPALQDLSRFNQIPDRLQQGFLDFLYLGRLLIHPNGFASDPAFQFNGNSAIDPSEVFYYGNSQGGIAGGALTAIATDITRSVLYVPGMTYATLLPRSVDFNDPDPTALDFASILYPAYPEESSRPLALTLIQSMWDRGEPDGYANHMTTDALPGTPQHKVLILMAYGDHQVANVQTAVEARTIGAPLRRPAVDASRIPSAYTDLFPDLGTLGDLSGPAADGSGYFIWDIGDKRPDPSTPDPNDVLGTDPPPITNTPPPGDAAGVDPHDTVIRKSPLARAQIAAFIDTNGKITNPCGPNPCYAAGYHGFP
jgi:hypothetical protein